jgi:hypothetical protein
MKTVEEEVAPQVRLLLNRAGLTIVLREIVRWSRERSLRSRITRDLRAVLAAYEGRYDR